MKICLLSNPQSVHTQRWATYFVQRSHQVEVVSIRPGTIDGVGVRAVTLRSRPASTNVRILLSYLTLASAIRRIVADLKPDILHGHYAAHHGIIGAFAKFHPYVISPWGSDVLDPPGSLPIFRSFIGWAFREADALTPSSEMLAQVTRSLSGNETPILIVPIGCDLTLFCPQQGENRGKVTIGIVKTLERKYGVEHLIRAFALLAPRWPNAELRIVGGGSLLKSLKSLAHLLGVAERVHFVGRVPHARVPSELAKMDVFVAPSILPSETLGAAVIEAAAMELPVVVSNIGGLPETLIDGVTGFLVPPCDPAALSEVLETLLAEPSLRSRMGRAGREFVAERYDWQENAGRMERLYMQLIERGTVK